MLCVSEAALSDSGYGCDTLEKQEYSEINLCTKGKDICIRIIHDRSVNGWTAVKEWMNIVELKFCELIQIPVQAQC